MPKKGKNDQVHNGKNSNQVAQQPAWFESVSYNKAPSVSSSHNHVTGVRNNKQEIKKEIQGISSTIPQDGESSVERHTAANQGKLSDVFKEALDEVSVARDGWTIIDYNGRLDGLKSTLKDRATSLVSVVKGYKDATTDLGKLNIASMNTSDMQHMINDLNAVIAGKLNARALESFAKNMMPMERLAVNMTRYMDHEAGTLNQIDIGDQFRTVTLNDSTHLRDKANDPWASSQSMDGYHGEAQISYIIPTPVTTDLLVKLRLAGVSDRYLFDLGNYTNSETRNNYETDWTGVTRTDMDYRDTHRERSVSTLFTTRITINDIKFDEFTEDQKQVWDTLFAMIDAVNAYAYGMGDNLMGVDSSIYNTLTPNSWIAPNSEIDALKADGISAEFLNNLVRNNNAYFNESLVPAKGNVDLDLNTENSATSPIFANLGAVKTGTSLFNADFAIKLWMQAYMNTVFLYYATADMWHDALKVNKVANMFKDGKPFTTIDDVYQIIANTDYASKVEKLIGQYKDISSGKLTVLINKDLMNLLIKNTPQEISYAKNGNYFEYISNLVLPLSPSMMTIPFKTESLSNSKFAVPEMSAVMLTNYSDMKNGTKGHPFVLPSSKLVQKQMNKTSFGKLTNLDLAARYENNDLVGVIIKGDKLYKEACGLNSTNKNPGDMVKGTVKKIENMNKHKDMKNPVIINGDSNINAAFKKDGNGGGSFGAFTNDKNGKVKWAFSFNYTNTVSRFSDNRNEFNNIYIPEGLARSVMTNHWTDGIVLNGMIVDPRLMQQKAIEINFFNLMNLYDDVLTLTQIDSFKFDHANKANMAAMLAREISFTPDIAGPADLDVMTHIKVSGRDVPIIASSPLFPFIYNGTLRAPAIKGDMHTNRVYTTVNSLEGQIDPRILNSSASGLPEAGANRDIIRIKEVAGSIKYTAKPLVLQYYNGKNPTTASLYERYDEACSGEDNISSAVKVLYSNRSKDINYNDPNLHSLNTSPLYNFLCSDYGPNDPRNRLFLFVPAMGIELAEEITRAVPRHYIIAKAFMLSILRKRWSGLLRSSANDTARTLSLVEKFTRGTNWLVAQNVTVDDLDKISHVSFKALDKELLKPTVEVRTTHDLTATRMANTNSPKFAESLDTIDNAFNVDMPIQTTAVKQVACDYLALGLFNEINSNKIKFGDIHNIASQPTRLVNMEAVNKDRNFFANNKLLLVSTPMSNYKGMSSTIRTKTYISPISVHSVVDMDKASSINTIDYMHRLGGVVTNRMRFDSEDLVYNNDLIKDTITRSIEFDEYLGEMYTNDVVLPSIYDTPYAYVANDPMMVQVGVNNYGEANRTFADISWMKYVNGPDMSRRGYSLFNMATVPAFSRHANYSSLSNQEYNPMVVLPKQGIRSAALRQRQLTNPNKYLMFTNPEGVGDSSKKYLFGEYVYLSETPVSLISRYSGLVTTGVEYWPTTIAKGCYAKSMTDRFANFEIADSDAFDKSRALQRILIPTQNVMNRDQFHGYLNRIIWNLIDEYSLDKGYAEFMRALDNAITVIKLPFGKDTKFDTSGLNAIYAGRTGYEPKVHMDVMLYGITSPIHQHEDTNTYIATGIVGIYNMDGYTDAATLRGSYGINNALATIRREFVSVIGSSANNAYYMPYGYNTYNVLGYDITPVRAEHNKANGSTVFVREHASSSHVVALPFQKVRGEADLEYLIKTMSTPAYIDYCYAHGNDPFLYYFNKFNPGYFSILTDNGLLQSKVDFMDEYINKYKVNWSVKVNEVDYSVQQQMIRNWSK